MAIELATLGVFTLVVQPRLLASVDRILVRETQQELETVADSLLPFLIQNQFAGIRENLDALRARQPTWRHVELVGEGGRRLYPLRPEPTPISSNIEHFSNAIRFRDVPLANIRVAVDFTADRAGIQSLALAFFLTFAGVFTVAMVLVAIFLDLAVGRRARELSLAADRLAHRDYAAVLPKAGSDEIGDLVRSFATMRDSVRNYEASLQDARIAAEAANHAKSEFLATMSHEIRTPLNGVLGMAQLLMMRDVSEEERLDYTQTILNSGQTLLSLLNNILDFSKIEAGKSDLTLGLVDVSQIVQETTALFLELGQSKGLEVDAVWLGPADQDYLADAIRLRQMISNLLSNAIKFTPHGFVRLEATELERQGEVAVLEFAVSDSGIGVPQDKQALLFQRFSQADSSNTREYGGTGLGLSIVRSLALQMGGDVGMRNEPGQGSRFWFRIRAEAVHKAQIKPSIEQDKPAGENTGETAQYMAGRILVVEDTLMNRKVIEVFLRKLGIQYDTVENGKQAVDAITQGMRPDLVLMDVHMPVMDGLQATRQIRLWEKESGQVHIPIIALTAGAFAQDRENCLAAGMDDFLAKPLNMVDLQAMLEKWPGFNPPQAN